MKRNEKFLRELGGVDDAFIEEARPSLRGKARRGMWVKWCAAAVACLLLVSTGLWLFVPYDTTPPSADQYKPSPYYSVIAALVEYNYNPPKYENNFDAVLDGRGGVFEDIKDGIAMGGAPQAPGAAEGDIWNGATDDSGNGFSDAVDVTDNQVAGVEEADIIKRTGTHAFHLSNTNLAAFTIDKEASNKISQTNLKAAFGQVGYRFADVRAREMFLSADGGTVTVLATCVPESGRGTVVGVLSIDVTSPVMPVPVCAMTVSGGYTDARRVGDSILLFAEFYSPVSPNYNDPTAFVPTVTTSEGAAAIPA